MRIRAFLRESVAATRRATRKKGGAMWDWSWAGWGWVSRGGIGRGGEREVLGESEVTRVACLRRWCVRYCTLRYSARTISHPVVVSLPPNQTCLLDSVCGRI
jgi:hypothetical protein